MKALNQLVVDKDEVLKDLCSIAETLDNNAELEKKVIASESELDVVCQMFQDYINSTSITEEELTTGRYCELETRYSEAKKAADKLSDELTDRRRRAALVRRFTSEVAAFDQPFTEFTEEAWLGLADSITIQENGTAAVKFKSGMEVTVG